MSGSRAWSLITLQAGERQYGGNTGYSDDVERIYRYDSNVPNHKRLSSGDLVFVRNAESLLGIAQIEEVTSEPSRKLRQRCPACGSTAIKFRKSMPVPWRCSKGHEFEVPTSEYIDVTAYEAHYGRTFLRVPEAVPVAELKAAALRPNDQLSIEEVDLARVERALIGRFPMTSRLISSFLQGSVLASSDADEECESADGPAPYVATMTDTREKVLRSIRVRRGQRAFRDKLIRRYGARCMASGCELMDIVEAAHIDPFRGEKDNHPENGLLLRTDLHTLFDLNLMGINPDGFVLRFHSKVRDESYRNLSGKSLQIGGRLMPAQAALQRRWEAFIRNRFQPSGLDVLLL